MKPVKLILLLLILTIGTGCDSFWNEETRNLMDLRKDLILRFDTDLVTVGKDEVETNVDGVLIDRKYFLRVEFYNPYVLHSWSDEKNREVAKFIHPQKFQPLDSILIIVKRAKKDTVNQITYSFSPDSLNKLKD